MSAPAQVAVAIVSHSPEIARGTAAMVHQMVGSDVRVGYCGGNADGGLGTDVETIRAMLEDVWTHAGVAVLVDLGGAEMNTEMAIEMLSEDKRAGFTICNAAIVEGAVMAATQASTGSGLQEVQQAAEDAIG
ncbi:PTS mannose transporter subunit IID [Rhodovibrio sodomensis]|uniref:phosphoenolpyruvate--glycerone phosphotransferase n=1 Tax=Rhodovibrio sodomensis TaxID=1088 RepID=A0ABS1DKK2_9PROT|nr:dihydroxyacetone kinase phosphoryl donor subunit DhaM [Rhodovibrio sodomensis]MBK1670637.1 PTS mannose transporter subunit IID [Rhodovibrio sodomensis]